MKSSLFNKVGYTYTLNYSGFISPSYINSMRDIFAYAVNARKIVAEKENMEFFLSDDDPVLQEGEIVKIWLDSSEGRFKCESLNSIKEKRVAVIIDDVTNVITTKYKEALITLEDWEAENRIKENAIINAHKPDSLEEAKNTYLYPVLALLLNKPKEKDVLYKLKTLEIKHTKQAAIVDGLLDSKDLASTLRMISAEAAVDSILEAVRAIEEFFFSQLNLQGIVGYVAIPDDKSNVGFCNPRSHFFLNDDVVSANGRLKRLGGDALCKKREKFFGLIENPNKPKHVNCFACRNHMINLIDWSLIK
ncbi:MAG: hypothetical protein ACJAS1_001640 [Oleiphilaceae bacterium]|jgi:hypothetical protein